MRRLARSSRNLVDVYVEDRRASERDLAQARLLARLAQGHAAQIGVAVGVAAQLQPLTKFSVMREQHAFERAIDDPRRAGQMPDREASLETLRLRGDEGAEALDHQTLALVARAIDGEFVEQAPAAGTYYRERHVSPIGLPRKSSTSWPIVRRIITRSGRHSRRQKSEG